MNKKKIWLVIPAALLPYLALFALATIFLSAEVPFFRHIMEAVFQSNALLLVGVLALCCVATLVFSIVCFAVSIRRGWDALSLAKNALALKLLQAPAYVLIFVLGGAFAFTLFTIPFAVGLWLLDCLTLLLSGLFMIAAVINAIRQGNFKPKEVLWVMILQLFFCVDVVASVVFYLKLRKKRKERQ